MGSPSPSRIRSPAPPKGEPLAGRATSYCLPMARYGAKGRALLQRAGFPLYNLSVSVLALSVTFGDSSPKGGALGRPGHFLLPAYGPIWRKRAGLATEGRLPFVQPLRLTSFDSSPSRGASGETVHFAETAKASPTRRGGIASAMTERLYEDRAFPLQESPARRIASSIFLPKFMVYLFCGLARPLTPDQQDGMGGKTCCCCRRTCFFKLYADKLEKRRFTQNVQPQKNCGLLWHYR